MLKKIDPLLNADILHALCQMGHGDEIAIVDAHYAAEKAAQKTMYKLDQYSWTVELARPEATRHK